MQEITIIFNYITKASAMQICIELQASISQSLFLEKKAKTTSHY
jgi:hypothetical protein